MPVTVFIDRLCLCRCKDKKKTGGEKEIYCEISIYLVVDADDLETRKIID